MPAKSKQQQKFMGMVHALNKGDIKPSDVSKSVKNVAKTISKGSRTNVDPTEGGATLKESDVQKMSAKEFEEREEEISKAMRSGKFVYDLTGSAR